MSDYKKITICPSMLNASQKGCTQALNEITTLYIPQITRGIRAQYKNTKLPSELELIDLVQEAVMAFRGAILTFDLNKNINGSLFSFCMKKTHWKVIDYLRIENKRLARYESGIKSCDVKIACVSEPLLTKTIFKSLALLSTRDQNICLELIFTGDISIESRNRYGIARHQCMRIYKAFKDNLAQKLA